MHAPVGLLALLGRRLRGFWVIVLYNSFSGLQRRFDYKRGTNSEFEVRFLLLTPTLPVLVFKKRFLFAGAILDDFRPDSFFTEMVL